MTDPALLVYLAISELRNGKWTTKKLAATPFESDQFSGAYDDSQFLVVPLDLTWLPSVLYPNGPPPGAVSAQYQWLIDGTFIIYVRDQATSRMQLFAMAGCRGYPEDFPGELLVTPIITTFQQSRLQYDRNAATEAATDLTPASGTFLPAVEILGNLPSEFKILYPHYLSVFDRLLFLFGVLGDLAGSTPAQMPTAHHDLKRIYALLGSFYDWFYTDSKRTFHVRPELFLPKQKLALFYEQFIVRSACRRTSSSKTP